MKKTIHLLLLACTALLLSFNTVSSTYAGDIPLDDDRKQEIIDQFNEEFLIGKATYEGSEISIVIELEELALELGWTPYMFMEYTKTEDGQASFLMFTEFLQDVHRENFRASGFESIKIELVYLNEKVQELNTTI